MYNSSDERNVRQRERTLLLEGITFTAKGPQVLSWAFHIRVMNLTRTTTSTGGGRHCLLNRADSNQQRTEIFTLC